MFLDSSNVLPVAIDNLANPPAASSLNPICLVNLTNCTFKSAVNLELNPNCLPNSIFASTKRAVLTAASPDATAILLKSCLRSRASSSLNTKFFCNLAT